MIKKFLFNLVLLLATLLPKLGTFGSPLFYECNAGLLHTIGILSIVFHALDIAALLCFGAMAKASNTPIETYGVLKCCWNCLYFFLMIVGIIMGTVAVHGD